MTDLATHTNGKTPRAMPATPKESREEKFVRLAIHRMTALKRRGRHVASLASYPHTEAQRAKVIGEVRKVADDIVAAFEHTDAFEF